MTAVEPELRSYEVTKTATNSPIPLPRISWGAILAGLVAAFIVQMIMEMLGMAIGLATINPETEAQAVGPNFGTAVVIWLASTTLLSLFTGGWVAARLSGARDMIDAFLHGFVTFGVVMLATFVLLTSGATSLINGVSNTISSGLGLIGQSAADIAPDVQRAVDLQLTTEDGIREEVNTLLPEGAELSSSANLRVAVEDLLATIIAGEDTATIREELVTSLANQTELSQAEASQRVDQWIASVERTATRAQEAAERVSGDIADALAATAGVIFAILIVGLFAAGAGSLVGRIDEEVYVQMHTRTETVA